MAHKTWNEKLNKVGNLPKVVKLNPKQIAKFKANTLAIPSPPEANELMAKIPKGRLNTINLMREKIAWRHKADSGCPITTGIFAWISSYAAEESRDLGKKRITPYWRTLKNGGELNPKYPGGIKQQQKALEEEGHTIIQKGKRFFVKDFEKKLVK
ncbi:MAG TPA: hypothetical protein DCX92_01950 [Bacteroidetes bacterium]|nr:hypothetical protein [Bacteroidota bacterium]